eukprot:COSAG03_NODE_20_length_21605_cov_27.875523_22_plen_117_part_00
MREGGRAGLPVTRLTESTAQTCVQSIGFVQQGSASSNSPIWALRHPRGSAEDPAGRSARSRSPALVVGAEAKRPSALQALQATFGRPQGSAACVAGRPAAAEPAEGAVRRRPMEVS